ncbi:MAG: DUF4863 family protein [Myxococcota bacterium]
MPTKEALIEAFGPIAERVAAIDLTDAPTAEAALNEAFPVSELGELRAQMIAASEEGWLTPRENAGVRFGRLAKPVDATHGLSIDVVDMTSGGPGHTHPNGEASLCFALEGTPTFMDKPEGWVVAAAGTHHVPTVAGGRMLIAYFLPDGAMVFD